MKFSVAKCRPCSLDERLHGRWRLPGWRGIEQNADGLTGGINHENFILNRFVITTVKCVLFDVL